MKNLFIVVVLSCAFSSLAAQNSVSVTATAQPALQPSVAAATVITTVDSSAQQEGAMRNVQMTVVPSTTLAPVTASVTVDPVTEETKNTTAKTAPAVQEQTLNLSAKPAPTGVETKTESPK